MRIYLAAEDRVLVAERRDGEWEATETLSDAQPQCLDASPGVALCGTSGDGLHRSRDGGDSWERVGTEALPDRVTAVTATGDALYCGTEPSRVYRSRDDGATWTRLEGLLDAPSADEWSFPPRPETHHVRWIEPHPRDPDRLYVAVEAGALLVTPDAGETWVDRPQGSRRDTHTLATHPDAPDRVYAAAGDGYAESRDAGETWRHPQRGLEHRYCWSVAPDPGDPDTVLLSCAAGPRAAHDHPPESFLYRRTGEEWSRVDDGVATGRGVYRSALTTGTRGGEVYAANNEGVFRTRDAGVTWTRLDIPRPDPLLEQKVNGFAVVETR